jgi:hypothetical protein
MSPRARWTGAGPAGPLPLEGLRERFLPECTFRGKQNTKLPVTRTPDIATR